VIRLQSKHLVVGLSLALTMAMAGCQPKEEKPATTGEATPSAATEAPAATAPGATTQAAGGADVKKGEELYTANCASCHQATGEGMTGTFPPLAGSEFTNGPAKDHITIVLKGKSGPITVKGQQYNGAMPPFAQLTDAEIADIVSYERTAWGNKGGMVSADDVKALR